MNTILSIKNFRVFDNNGVTLNYKPITVLTGCNSSGKSSIVKGACLVNQFIQQIKDSIKDGQPVRLGDAFEKVLSLDFSKAPNNLLGNFQQVVNKYSNEKTISFSYRVHSQILNDDIIIDFVFGMKDADALKDGYLSSLTIRLVEGDVLYLTDTDATYINRKVLKPYFFNYVSEEKLTTISDDLPTKFKPYETLIRKMNEQNVITYFPILSKLADLDCQQIESVLRNRLSPKKYSDTTKTNLDKRLASYYSRLESNLNQLLDSYKNSNNDSFLDFVINQENIWESHYNQPFAFPSIPNRCFDVTDDDSIENVIEHNSLLYALIDVLSKLLSPDEKMEVLTEYNKYQEIDLLEENYIPLKLFDMFISEMLSNLFLKELPDEISYVSSDLVNIRRLYTLDSTDDFTSLLKQYFVRCRTQLSPLPPDEVPVGLFMNKWIKEFGIGDRVSIKPVEEGTGVQIRIFKDKNDKDGSLLADYGYGITQLIAIMLSIEVNRGKCGKSIAIEEPEIHLHPNYQSKLAEMFVEAYQKYNIHFVIETHSEYLIRKLQVLVANKENELLANDVSLNYVEKDVSGVSTNRKIGIKDDGTLMDSFGEGFYDEAGGLSRQLFKLSM